MPYTYRIYNCEYLCAYLFSSSLPSPLPGQDEHVVQAAPVLPIAMALAHSMSSM